MTYPGMDELRTALTGWLPQRGWFAANGREMRDVRIRRATELVDRRPAGGPLALLLVLEASFTDGGAQHYQVLLGLRRTVSPELRRAVFAEVGGHAVYDALADAELVAVLLSTMDSGRDVDDLEFRSVGGIPELSEVHVRPISGEQSNSSVVIDERMVLKVFRRLQPGVNPDVELHRALERARNPHVPRFLGAVHGRLDGLPTSLLTLQEFVPGTTSGWDAALRSLAGHLAGESTADVAESARALGEAVAAVHRDLAEVFGTSSLDPASITCELKSAVELAVDSAPVLAPHAAALQELVDSLAVGHDRPLAQRVHGDLHLGQVLRSERGWVVLDFEGEPDRPLSARVRHASPWRDVAGMLRSYDYAADHTTASADDPGTTAVRRARAWAETAKRAFLAGYESTSGRRADRAVLDAFVLGKALYEVAYDARHRPSWTTIPLSGVLRLLEARHVR
ncbi:maltokinase N-terminal cap-like domain-containing protein [Saccharopolyspora rosea]|uniref:maltokinase N-terminal cap-like domain-containing protein n=1 Tax=Saccharopolyspora rosea TaxID=524884 RepID=UPI0021DADCE0|nr:aminoglycoside phosphotransferase [Saccharopolyspora rosea]